jgi:hypothetical protein
MKNKLLKTFYSSILYRLYLDYVYWKDKQSLENTLIDSLGSLKSNTYYQQDQTQHKYQEGLGLLKKAVKAASNGNPTAYLTATGDMVKLADITDADTIKTTQILRKFYVNKSVDVRTEKDKEAMIDQRILHFYELQQHKLDREKRRKEKQNGKNP